MTAADLRRARPLALLGLLAAIALAAQSLRGGAVQLAAATGLAVAAAAAYGLRHRHATTPAVDVTARAALSRESGVALVEVDGRRLLLGYARGGVALVADLGAPAREVRP